MLAKTVVVLALVAAASAGAPALGYLGSAGPYHLGAQAEHTVRGYGGLSTVSHQSKSVVSPHSHVQKTDTRYTNDALVGAYGGYAAPALAHGAYAAPALAAHGAYAAPALAHGAYAAPAYAAHSYAAAPVAHAHGYGAQVLSGHGYAHAAAPLAHGYAHAAPLAHGYAAPALAAHHGAYAAPALAHHGYAAKAVAAPIASYSFTRNYPAGTLAYAY